MLFRFYFQPFSLRAKKNFSVTKESPSEASELLNRLAMLEEQVMMMGDQLNKVN